MHNEQVLASRFLSLSQDEDLEVLAHARAHAQEPKEGGRANPEI